MPRRNLNAIQPVVRRETERAKRPCKRPCASEHLEAVTLMKAVRLAERQQPELALFFAVPNGGHRSKAAAGKAKAEGVRRGVPDYLFPVPRGGHIGLAIELKAADGRESPEQRVFLAALRRHGWRAVTCHGWAQAWDCLRDYLASDAQPEDDDE